MNWKETYTKLFLKELGKSTNDATVKEYMPLWWKNNRHKNEGGLRLTETGIALSLNAVNKLRELSPLWDMYKDGVDLDTVQWAAH